MSSLDVVFENLMNESFAKDISKKVRTSFDISKKNGNYIGIAAPFGYLKEQDDNHKFIVDKKERKKLRKILDELKDNYKNNVVSKKDYELIKDRPNIIYKSNDDLNGLILFYICLMNNYIMKLID